MHLSFLSEFLNPVYLQLQMMKALTQRFVEESSLELHSLLCMPDKLQLGLMEKDQRDGLGPDCIMRIPPYTAGGRWCIGGQGPAAQVAVLRAKSARRRGSTGAFPRWAQRSHDEVVRSLQDELFSSVTFHAWLIASRGSSHCTTSWRHAGLGQASIIPLR
ncbi:hypothetical protein A0H81_06559 [Grifola frondosa]|uniref:Oxoglutarate/iron-dependent oxygenase C-terminal degradation domain-containing protein n=1 Tax=Grifola frondosa TaxID=5627 RepID=A0A1C7MAJ6_GRIFR|nr:hypothetical protein A0H81_06559 [Grifola frondosa]